MKIENKLKWIHSISDVRIISVVVRASAGTGMWIIKI